MVAHTTHTSVSPDVTPGVSAPLDPRLLRRREQFAAQRLLGRLSSLKAVRGCGVRWVEGVSAVGLRVTHTEHGRRAGLAGLRTCGSVWACPVCSVKILTHRQSEIQRAAEVWRSRPGGGSISMFTYTVRHDRSMTIEQVWDAVSSAQHAMTSGREHQREKIAYGVVSDELVNDCDVQACGAVVDSCSASVHLHPGLVDERYDCEVACCGDPGPRGRRHAAVCRGGLLTARARRAAAHLAVCRLGQPTLAALRHAPVCRLGEPVTAVLPWLRVVEVTVGDNGWHVHQHMPVFLPAGTTDLERDALYRSMWERWSRGAAAAGCDGSLQVNKAVWVTDNLKGFGEYLTKAQYTGPQVLALEVARPDLKSARFDNRSTFELLRDVVANRDPADVALWHAFERGSLGRRQMTWAHGARELLAALGAFDVVEREDADVAATETGTVDETVCWLPFESWRWLLSAPGRKADLLDAFEVSDVDGFAWLLLHAVRWERVDGSAGGPSTFVDGPTIHTG